MPLRMATRQQATAGRRAFAAGVACALLWAGAVAACGAQQTLYVTTRLVQVNVIALDRHGQPVKGLTRNDFKVFDNGKPQKIAIFRVESNQPAAVRLPALPPNTFSNTAERAGTAPPSVTVILLDALNTPFASQAYARQQVIKFLQQLRPNDHVALYVLTNRLVILHDFTQDASELLEALREYRGRKVSELHSTVERNTGGAVGGLAGPVNPGAQETAALLGQSLRETQALERNYYARQRVKITANALVAIANHLAGLPGRKNLIWVSGGFPMWSNLNKKLNPNEPNGLMDFHSPVSRAARALNNVNLAIYPVDARGLDAPVESDMERNFIQERENNFSTNFATMDELAKRTGGRAFYNTNGIRQSIRRVVDDSRVTYVLAYYPRNVKWKGEFRKIKIRVDRHGVQLQYRHGYSALPPGKPPTHVSAAELAEAVASPLDATGIGLRVDVLPGNKASAVAYLLRVRVDPRDVTFGRQGGLQTASLTVVTNEFGPQGKSLKGLSQKIQLHLKPATYRQILARGLVFGERLPAPLPYSTERLRVVLRDNATGNIGSVNVPLNRSFRPAKPSSTKSIPGG